MLNDIIKIARQWKIGTFLGASEVDAVGYLIAEIANLQAENERLKQGIAKAAESVGIRPQVERREFASKTREQRSIPQLETHLSLIGLPMRLQVELASLERQRAESPIGSIDRSALGILLPKLQELTRLTKFVLGETQPAEHSPPSQPPSNPLP
jgi:hypothetical protein